MKTAYQIKYNRALSWTKRVNKLIDRLDFEMSHADDKTAKKMARKINHLMADMEKRPLYDYYEEEYKFHKQ